MALAREVDRLQRNAHQRLQRYEQAARAYLAAFRSCVSPEATLDEAHSTAVSLAERLLPATPCGG